MAFSSTSRGSDLAHFGQNPGCLAQIPRVLEIINPGPLPLGVTPSNVLHALVRRNEHLARLCHDLKLMEREGSGYDAINDILLSQGRLAPSVEEGSDWVKVTLKRKAPERRIIEFIGKAGEAYPLSQRERITLGLLAHHESLTSIELCGLLELDKADQLKPWLGRLVHLGWVISSGRAKGTSYSIAGHLMQTLDFRSPTTLKAIEPYRLAELVMADLRRYGEASISEIQGRVGSEIPRRRLQLILARLVDEGQIQLIGRRRYSRYRLSGSMNGSQFNP